MPNRLDIKCEQAATYRVQQLEWEKCRLDRREVGDRDRKAICAMRWQPLGVKRQIPARQMSLAFNAA